VELWPYVIHNKWLFEYGNIQSMQKVFYGMDRKSAFKSNLSNGLEIFKEHEKDITQCFFDFYPLLMTYTQDYLKSKNVTTLHL
jgi:acyl carrier protein phosphodiesterase